MAPGIDELRPKAGWQGSIVEILGTGFSGARDDNDVQVGGDRALVIEADPARLLILVGENAVTGPLTVTVGGATADAGEFTILEQPDAADPFATAAPAFFHGPQHGTPSTNRADQRVLVLPVFATDNPPRPESTSSPRSAPSSTRPTSSGVKLRTAPPPGHSTTTRPGSHCRKRRRSTSSTRATWTPPASPSSAPTSGSSAVAVPSSARRGEGSCRCCTHRRCPGASCSARAAATAPRRSRSSTWAHGSTSVLRAGRSRSTTSRTRVPPP